jgi:hypothetical protein
MKANNTSCGRYNSGELIAGLVASTAAPPPSSTNCEPATAPTEQEPRLFEKDNGEPETIAPYAPQATGFIPRCEQCDEPLPAKDRQHGSPQRFCGTKCRKAFHKASPKSETHRTNPPAVVDKPREDSRAFDEECFDWLGDDVVLDEQPAVAIYFNPKDALVIRQQAQDPFDPDDPFIYIAKRNIDEFIDKLCDIVGIPRAGKQ